MNTILIVDDDPFQASVMTSVLGRQFGDVRRVSDAAEALGLIEQPEFARDLRLLISGGHTHALGGADFVAELHARMPGLPVMVLGTNGSGRAEYADQDVVFIARPAASDTVLSVTRQMLARHEIAA